MSAEAATERPAGGSPRTRARLAGVLYLVVIAGGVFAELFVRGRLVAAGDAVATAQNIRAHGTLFRAGFVAELLICCVNMPLAVIFYDLFRIVDRTAAVLVVFFTLMGSALEAASLLLHLAPAVLLGGGPSLAAVPPDQLQDLAYASLRLFEYGFAAALVPFGFYCLSIGYLVSRSRFMPRIIGALLVLAGLCYLTNSLAEFLAPGFARRLVPYIQLPSGVAELALCLWLLLIGVNVERWREQAAAAAGSPS